MRTSGEAHPSLFVPQWEHALYVFICLNPRVFARVSFWPPSWL